jgi:hypothetical protein
VAENPRSVIRRRGAVPRDVAVHDIQYHEYTNDSRCGHKTLVEVCTGQGQLTHVPVRGCAGDGKVNCDYVAFCSWAITGPEVASEGV